MRLSALAFVMSTLAATAAIAAPERYEFDKSHTNILFHINHLGFSDMIGLMTTYDGYFTFDEKMPEKSTLDVTIRPSGIRTSSDILDHELQGEKWFNTDKFPEIHFASNSIKLTGANTGDVTGNMTMLGVTKPEVLHVTFNKGGIHPMTQALVAGFSATMEIKRSDFGLSNGIPMVGDTVRIEVQTEGQNMDRKKQEAIKH